MMNLIKAVGACIGYIALYFLVSILIMIGIVVYHSFQAGFAMTADESADAVFLGFEYFVYENANLLTILVNLISLLLYFLIIKLRKRKLAKHIDLVPMPFQKLWPVLPLGFSLNVLTDVVLSLLPIPQSVFDDYADSVGMLDNGSFLASLLSVIIIAPVFEEILFRGLILNALKKAMLLPAAIVLQGLIFGLMHGQILWVGYSFVLGVVFSIVKIRYQSLYASILLHFSYNAASYILALAEGLAENWIFGIALAPASLAMTILFGIMIYKRTKPPMPAIETETASECSCCRSKSSILH